ncbi:MAG: hypothetical protein KA313_06080 [Pseudarcicella sp.]|nr:hypothetical protein [Pseudarcicella sp.]MBP6410650.1 hypothetical protein [Pseudarcicella sp.]
MKQNILYTIVLLAIFNITTFSQSVNLQAKEKIRLAKIAYIKSRINLTEEQSEPFWSAYNDIDKKRIDSRINRANLISSSSNMTNSDAKILADLKETFTQRQRELDLEKELFNKLQKIINPRQIAEFFKAEVEFRNKLLNKTQDFGNKE